MRKWVENLLALQEQDIRVRTLSLKLEMLPSEKQKLKAELEAEQQKLKDAKAKVQKTEMEIKQLESTIKKLNDDSARLQTQSVMVKKNDEYQALLAECEKCKNKIGDCESQEIELLDRVEAERIFLKQFEKNSVETAKAINSEIQELDQLAGELKEEIARVNAGRQAFAEKVEPALYDDYSRLLGGRKGGIPLVKVVQENCGNCHLKLTPQSINQARKGVITRCDNCSHIIYMDEE